MENTLLIYTYRSAYEYFIADNKPWDSTHAATDMEIISCLLQVPHWVSITCHFFVGLHDFLYLEEKKNKMKPRPFLRTKSHSPPFPRKAYLDIDEIVEWVYVLLHQAFHLKINAHSK